MFVGVLIKDMTEAVCTSATFRIQAKPQSRVQRAKFREAAVMNDISRIRHIRIEYYVVHKHYAIYTRGGVSINRKDSKSLTCRVLIGTHAYAEREIEYMIMSWLSHYLRT